MQQRRFYPRSWWAPGLALILTILLYSAYCLYAFFCVRSETSSPIYLNSRRNDTFSSSNNTESATVNNTTIEQPHNESIAPGKSSWKKTAIAVGTGVLATMLRNQLGTQQAKEATFGATEDDLNILRQYHSALIHKDELVLAVEAAQNELKRLHEDFEREYEATVAVYEDNMGLAMNLELRNEQTGAFSRLASSAIAQQVILKTEMQEKTVIQNAMRRTFDLKRSDDLHVKKKILLRPLLLNHIIRTKYPSQVVSRLGQAASGLTFMTLINAVAPIQLYMQSGLPVTIGQSIRFALPISNEVAEAVLNVGGYFISQAFRPDDKGFLLLARYHYAAEELKRVLEKDADIVRILNTLAADGAWHENSDSFQTWLKIHDGMSAYDEVRHEEQEWM